MPVVEKLPEDQKLCEEKIFLWGVSSSREARRGRPPLTPRGPRRGAASQAALGCARGARTAVLLAFAILSAVQSKGIGGEVHKRAFLSRSPLAIWLVLKAWSLRHRCYRIWRAFLTISLAR